MNKEPSNNYLNDTQTTTESENDFLADTARYAALMDRIAASPDPDRVTLDIPDAVAYTRINAGQLATLRYRGQGPKFIKPSPRVVLYFKKDIDEWLNNNVRTSNAEACE